MKYSKIFSLLLPTLAKCACTFPAGPPGKQGAKGKLEWWHCRCSIASLGLPRASSSFAFMGSLNLS